MTHAVLPSGWTAMRLGLPGPTGIVPVTSKVVVSMMETEFDLVFVTYRVAAGAAPTAARTNARPRAVITIRFTALPPSFRRLDRREHDVVRRGASQCKPDGV